VRIDVVQVEEERLREVGEAAARDFVDAARRPVEARGVDLLESA
jgi:hypothetical protein